MKRCIVYIPGLGDTRDFWQRAAVAAWQLFGVRTEFVSMKWYEGGTYEAKLRRVLDVIEAAKSKGYAVSIVGTSAGASMALNAAASSTDVHRIVTICGANDPYAHISPVTSKKSPSFETSLRTLESSLGKVDKNRIDTIYGWNDRIVASRHTILDGAHNHLVWGFGHLLTITACLTLYAGYVVHLAKK